MAQETALGAPAWLDVEAYPFAHRWRSLSAGALHYIDEGEGPPLVLVHGTPTWSFEYRHVIRALSRTRRCIAFDHLGFGLSARPQGFSYTPEAHAKNALEFVNSLGLASFDLVVHDFGGPIGLPVLFRYPEKVRRLILLNTWMWPFDDDPDMTKKARLAGSSLGRWMYRYLNASLRLITPSAYGDKKKLTPKIHQQYLKVFPDKDSRSLVLWALAKSMLGSRDFFASLYAQREALQKLPVQLIWGLKDSAFLPAQLEKWRQIIPQAHVDTLAGAGHWPHEEEPAQVSQWMAEFLSAP
jgi:haloalkane dehalogenase